MSTSVESNPNNYSPIEQIFAAEGFTHHQIVTYSKYLAPKEAQHALNGCEISAEAEARIWGNCISPAGRAIINECAEALKNL